MRQVIPSLLFFLSFPLFGQGYISYDYFSKSPLTDENGNHFGSGSMDIVSAGYHIPLSAKYNNRNQPIRWSSTIHGTYAKFSNSGEATRLNPDKIINAGINVSHLHPISKKWSILTSIGGGVYAPVKEISVRSILGNGGAIFICKVNHNLHLGIGGGISNSFGTPMAMPMLYLNWQRHGQFQIQIDMSNNIKIAASTWLQKKFKLELTALEIDGLTAITQMDNKEQIYSMTMLRSSLSPSYHFSDKFSLFLSVSGNWIRGISVTERSLKGFFNSFKEENDENPYFQAALRLSTGIKFSF